MAKYQVSLFLEAVCAESEDEALEKAEKMIRAGEFDPNQLRIEGEEAE